MLAVAPSHRKRSSTDPFADGLVAAHPAQGRGGGQRQHRGKRMAPTLAAAGVVDGVEELGKGTHLCGAEHHLGDSMSQAGVEMGGAQRCPRAPAQGMDEHELGPCMCAVAVAAALAAEAACARPRSSSRRGRRCRGSGWVDERFDEQQRVGETAGQSLTRRRVHSAAPASRGYGARRAGAGIGSCW